MRIVPTLLAILTCATLVPAWSADIGPKEPDIPPGQTRGEKAAKAGPMPYWNDRPDQAQPLVATFIGGTGTEWLCAGGFQPDGTIVLAGNCNGGEFGLALPESVLGKDGTKPAPAVFKVETDKRGRTITEKPSWLRDDTTGFLVFTTPDLQKITRVVRLPWTSAAITSMVVADDGSLYIAGRPGAGIASLGGKQEALAVPAEAARKDGKAEAAFVAKLTKDAGSVEWLFTASGKTDAPTVSFSAGGNISFAAQDLRVFDPTGKPITAVVVPGGVRETTAVSPVDGAVLRGGDRNTGTGREPWRCPILRVLEPDGSLRYQLYEWPSGYVGMDASRAVSDTVVRGTAFDQDGNILLKLWSDGGNSVAGAQPTDIRRGTPTQGLGLNAAGAGAISFSYLAKIEPKNFELIGWTMWISRYHGKPNSTSIESLSYGTDGSVLFTGESAWGLIQTGNKLANGEPAGQHIVVLTPDMNGVRFCSAVPGIGEADIGTYPTAIGQGTVKGKARALFLSGAKADQDVYGLVTKTPTRSALQGTFGGGATDGYVVMVDLSAGAPVVKAPVPPQPPRRLRVNDHGYVGQKPGQPKDPPASTQYEFSPTMPKWYHADAEFRVADASYWPNFVAGRADSGTATWAETGTSGSFTASFDLWAQDQGKQDRRVLGQLYKDGKPPALSVAVTSFGAMATETDTTTDRKGTPQQRVVEYQPLTASLTLGGTTTKLTLKAVSRRGKVVESEMQRLNVTGYATVKGSVLGLSGDLASKDIDIRINVQGIDPATVGLKRPKKK